VSVTAGERWVGARVERVEDARFLTGAARYTADVKLPRTLHAAFVRSPHGHARITGIDVEAALDTPGVIAVFTGHDTKELPPLVANVQMPGLMPTPQPILPLDRVRFVGQAVAVVLAEDRYLAEDGADLVDVEYEPLAAVASIETALDEDSEPLFEELGTNVIYRHEHRHGDAATAFSTAHKTYRRTYSTNRFVASPMETRSYLASFERIEQRLTVWSSTQMPHVLRWVLAGVFGLSEHHIRAIAPDVGGAFGQKMATYPEEIAVAFVSTQVGRPVRWVEDRRENLMAATHAKQQRATVAAAVDEEGKLLGLRAEFVGDAGGFSFNTASALIEPGLAGPMLPGPYRVPAYDFDVIAVVTNKSPVAPYRGIGWTAAQTARELLFEEIARDLGLDPAEFRRRNLITPEEMPHETCTGMHYDSGDYPGALRLALEGVDYEALRAEQAEAWHHGRYIGIGISPFVEQTGGGTACGVESGMPYPSSDNATVSIDLSGKVKVALGLASHGQGHQTSIAQMAADTLGVDLADIDVVQGDTDRVPFGFGTWASRSAVVGGGSVSLAAGDVREKLLSVAARTLEVDPADLVIERGVVKVVGVPDARLTIAEIAGSAYFDAALEPEQRALRSTRFYDPGATYANGCIVVVVEVDPELGKTTVRRIVAIEDCGTMLNPSIVDGQVRGAVVQGVGGALLESMEYSPDGQILTASFMDYLLPTAADVPRIEVSHMESPSPVTLHGIKGVGESGMVATPAAILMAILDALRPFEPGPVTGELDRDLGRGQRPELR
jgi:aerobic carbon-monoxide dehydrogenase large subunit